MKLVRKIISIMCVLIMLFSLTSYAIAAAIPGPVSEMERMMLVEALQDVEQQKQVWGLRDIDFSDLFIGYPISTYNYTDNGLIPGNKLYPIIKNNQLILWAILLDGSFQISTGLVGVINQIVGLWSNFALVYDCNSVYAYTGEALYCLQQFEAKDLSRAELPQDVMNFQENVALVSLSDNVPLRYVSTYSVSAGSRAVNYSCDVSFVSQAVPGAESLICWAACVACIRNYKQGTSYTAIDIARNHYGSNYNDTVTNQEIVTVLNNNGLPDYHLFLYGDFDSEIIASMIAGYPSVGIFSCNCGIFLHNNHAMVICGINPIAGRIRIMDPLTGINSISLTSNGYCYTNVTTNHVMTLTAAVCYDP